MDSQSQPVVVGYDGSEGSAVAVVWAAREAVRRRTALVVLHALDHPGLVGGPTGASPLLPALATDSAAAVARAGADRAARVAPELSISSAARPGSVPGVLIEAALGAQLLVVGTRGRGSLAGGVLGSVSAAVAAHASCPVVIAGGDSPPAPGPEVAIVVGVDGSVDAEEALRSAAVLADATGAPLVIVCAWRPPAGDNWSHAYWTSMHPGDTPNAAARRAAEDVVSSSSSIVASLFPSLAVRTHVDEGPADEVITAAAQGAALVVVGSRGRGSFAGLLLGSVSQGAARRATCPVMVTHGCTAAALSPETGLAAATRMVRQ